MAKLALLFDYKEVYFDLTTIILSIMTKKTFVFLFSALLFTQSCSTIFNGGSQSVIAGASGDKDNIAINVRTPRGSYRSKLPTTVVTTPSSFKDTTVTVNEKCYERTEMIVGKSVTPSFWANFLWGTAFPIAMGIDYLSGSMWRMDQQAVVPLNKKDSC